MKRYTTLNKLNIGDRCKIKDINISGNMYRRLLDIGLIEGTDVECVGMSPNGDPKAYYIRGAVIAIREENTKNIKVKQF